MKTLTIYHNPRCSKSRETLALLEASGKQFTVVEYLKSPPTLNTLKRLAKKLDNKEALFRKKETEYQAIQDLPFDERLSRITDHPILLERPIVESEGKAVVARPPELVKTILKG